MSEAELRIRFSDAVFNNVKIENHSAHAKENLYTVGTAFDGTPIQVNALLGKSDFIIAVGCIEPHRIAGFSGGAKMIQPGVCGEAITAALHWRGWCAEGTTIYGLVNNPIRHEINEIGKKAGLRFIVNVVLDHEGEPYRYFSGDPLQAFEAGCNVSKELCTVPMEPADIVIVDSNPFDMDMWQACKALSVAELVAQKGGYIILVTPCPEGLGMHSSQIAQTGYLHYSKILKSVAQGELPNLAIACHLMALGRILEFGHLLVVSPGLPPQELANVGLQSSPTVTMAIAQARRALGKSASIAIIRKACTLIPDCKNQS